MLVIFIYLAVNVAYLLFISIAGLLSRKKVTSSSSEKKRIAVLITSYKEDEVIVNTVQQAVEHNYPHDKFDVFLAADQLQPSTIEKIKQFRVDVNEVFFAVGSKARVAELFTE